MNITATPAQTYLAALAAARALVPQIADATSKPEEMPADARYFATEDLRSGYGIDADGTLIGLFSTERGRGGVLVASAVTNGATALDCFDGFLPAMYARRGWVETRRESNWTPGGPDVVYMHCVNVAAATAEAV